MAHRGTVDSERMERIGSCGGGGGGDGGCAGGKEHEENNNEVDALSKELSGMGCIVDAVRAHPTLCVDASACGDSGGESYRDEGDGASDEDAYLSEEFDVSASEVESEVAAVGAEGVGAGPGGGGGGGGAKSRSSLSTLRATRSSVDARSASGYGSLPVPRTNRVNMSFSNSRLRDIERENRILLNKIMSARGTKRASVAPAAAAPAAALAPAGYARRQQQRKIDHDNMILLRKIQRVKSSSCSLRR